MSRAEPATSDCDRARVIACCGGMVVVSGMERLTFEVLLVLKEEGAAIHCVLNSWENHRIRDLAESIGASWSVGSYRRPLRRTMNPWKWLLLFWDIAETSLGLLRDARRFRPTHVLVPEFGSVLRNAPALIGLRAMGVAVVLRMANHPDRGRFYSSLWRWVISPLVSTVVANSRFSFERAVDAGVPERKLRLIHNCLATRRPSPQGVSDTVRDLVNHRKTLLCVGQIAPYKGTHLAVRAVLDLLDHGCDVQLLVVGALPEWPPERVKYFRQLSELVRRSGYEAQVRFIGQREDVLTLMQASFLLVAPILQEETFGNVILEAVSVGLPVVAFPRGGVSELVAHRGTGFLCSSLDEEGVRKGIEHFLESAEAWESARQECLRTFGDPGNPYSRESFSASWCRAFSIPGGNG